jgi:adenine-specific DNA-methyltransferase
VNQKTRQPRPFFLNDCRNYDGAILALFPHRREADLARLVDMLNDVDWAELGFVCDGRFLFAQRSLEQALLPEDFAPFAVRQLV